jgi:hypothetical protein
MKKTKPSITKNSFSVQKKANGSTFFLRKNKNNPKTFHSVMKELYLLSQKQKNSSFLSTILKKKKNYYRAREKEAN